MDPTLDIWTYAMQMELDGEHYYRSAALRTKNEGVKTILISLADDEQKHFKLFEHLSTGTPTEVAKTQALKLSLNVFQKAVAQHQLFNTEPLDAATLEHTTEVYRKAIKMEQQSWEFYEAKAKEMKNAEQAKILQIIAAEEHLHERLLYNVLEWITRPEEWLACAEFSHIGEPSYGAGAT